MDLTIYRVGHLLVKLDESGLISRIGTVFWTGPRQRKIECKKGKSNWNYDKIKGRFKGVYSAGYRADGWVSLS